MAAVSNTVCGLAGSVFRVHPVQQRPGSLVSVVGVIAGRAGGARTPTFWAVARFRPSRPVPDASALCHTIVRYGTECRHDIVYMF